MNSASWGSTTWSGTFQNLSMRLFSEDFADELGGEGIESSRRASPGTAKSPSPFSIAQPETATAAISSPPKKEYTSEELQGHMKCLMTSKPQLWKEYKSELAKEENPTNPETVRRVLVDFLNRQEQKTMKKNLSLVAQWKPGNSPTQRRRPRQSTASLVNSLKDSLHQSLHAEKLQVPPERSNLVSRSPPRRGNIASREKLNKGMDDSEHSTSSASFHDDDDHNHALPTLQADTTQQKLMRLQQIPQLWMIYQSQRLEEQTTGMEGPEPGDSTNAFIPTADQSSLEVFWNKHEREIVEYEKEGEAAQKAAAAEEARRKRKASKIHIELNTSFHLEASASRAPRSPSGLGDDKMHTRSDHSGFSIGSLGSAKIHQDPIQKKLTRIQKSPELDLKFQQLLLAKDHPNDPKTIEETVEAFWLTHEKQLLEFERRMSLLHVDLNTSFHDEVEATTVYRPSQHRISPRTSVQNPDKRASFAAQRESVSTRSFRTIQTAMNDLTGELGQPMNKGSVGNVDTGHRTKMMQKYKQQGEGFSMRSMRSMRVAIDDLAGEVGTEAVDSGVVLLGNSSIRSGMMSFFSSTPSESSDPAIRPTKTEPQAPSEGLWGRLGHLLTQDLEAEMASPELRTPLTEQTTPRSQSPDFNIGGTGIIEEDEEDDDEFFKEAAQIAAHMKGRQPTAREKAKQDHDKAGPDGVNAQSHDPMDVFLRDPMLEVTMHDDDEDKIQQTEEEVVGESAVPVPAEHIESGRDEANLL